LSFIKKPRHTVSPSAQPSQICCIYAYYEKNEKYKKNFEHFLQHGILPNVDYFIVVNGLCTVVIPKYKNIHVYPRENKGYDFGAYSNGIKNMEKEYVKLISKMIGEQLFVEEIFISI
jgi:outer membrane protein assembly factor BamD (BamD/ComL family)